jgi:hypothetical protein
LKSVSAKEEIRGNVPLALRTHNVVNRMLVHALPGELLIRKVPLKHLPEDHRTGEHINLVVILGRRRPKLGCLPVNGTNQAPDHGASALLDLSQSKVGNLGMYTTSDENVGGLAVPMDDRRLEQVQVLEAFGNVEH